MSKLVLKTNIPSTFTLLYDKPYVPDPHPEYGQSYSYKFAKPLSDGADVWFATEKGHQLMQALHLKKGDRVELVREEEGTSKFFRINGKSLDDLNEPAGSLGAPIKEVMSNFQESDIAPGLYDRVATLEDAVQEIKKSIDAIRAWAQTKPWEKK